MLNVFICEDDREYRNMLHKHISKYIENERLDMKIELCTGNPNEIIKYVKDNEINGIYFFDIELGNNHNGVEIANIIRNHDPRGYIVFITAHPRYMSLTFKYRVEALAYIQKQETDTVLNDVYECMQNAYQKHVTRSITGCFTFQTHDRLKISCTHDDILFFETETSTSATNRLILHTKLRNYLLYSTLEKVLMELPMGSFILCHRSFIVNISNITEKARIGLCEGKDRMVMPNGAECLVSARKKRDLLKLLKSTSKI